MSLPSSPKQSCNYGYPANLNELTTQVRTAVPRELLLRYKQGTCVNEDLDYKLPQLISAASNDAGVGRVVERAAHVVGQCMLLRDVLDIGSILDDEYFPSGLIPRLEKWSSLSVVGDDVRGNTVIYFDLQNFNPTEYKACWDLGSREVPAGLKNHSEFDDPAVVNYCSLWYVRMMEWIHQSRFDSFKEGRVPEPRVVMILNVDSIGFSTYSTELKSFLKGIRIVGGYLYPEICDYIFAANVHWIADRFWPVIRLVLHHATASKVKIYDKHRTKKYLPELVPAADLPEALGGKCQPERMFKRNLTKYTIDDTGGQSPGTDDTTA